MRAAVWRPGLRPWLGLALWVLGGLAALDWAWREVIAGNAVVEMAAWAGGIAAMATALGTLPALLNAGTSERARDTLLGFGAGVMLAASAFSLIVPALEAARQQGLAPLPASLAVAGCVLLGAGLLLALDQIVPGRLERGQQRAAADGRRRARVWLFVLAVMLHNLPEGLAIGVGFGADSGQGGRALATGIAIQDVPEGLVVAMALRGVGLGRWAAVAIGALSGLVEPVAAVLGAVLVGASASLLVPGLGLAAGAMLFVIAHAIIPEAQRGHHGPRVASAIVVGFVLMMVLDTALG